MAAGFLVIFDFLYLSKDSKRLYAKKAKVFATALRPPAPPTVTQQGLVAFKRRINKQVPRFSSHFRTVEIDA